MKIITILLLILNNTFNNNLSNSNDSLINNEETKEVINKENKDGMIIALLGSLVIIEIGLIYKKKKIKL